MRSSYFCVMNLWCLRNSWNQMLILNFRSCGVCWKSQFLSSFQKVARKFVLNKAQPKSVLLFRTSIFGHPEDSAILEQYFEDKIIKFFLFRGLLGISAQPFLFVEETRPNRGLYVAVCWCLYNTGALLLTTVEGFEVDGFANHWNSPGLTIETYCNINLLCPPDVSTKCSILSVWKGPMVIGSTFSC